MPLTWGPRAVAWWWVFIDEDYILEEQRQTRKLILYNTSEEDAVAKRFESPVKGTVIYAYWDKGHVSNGNVSIDGQLSEFANGNGFFRWEIQPGNHQVQAHQKMYRGTINNFLNLRCEEGQTYFIRLKRFARPVIEVSVFFHNEGIREISKRKLILR